MNDWKERLSKRGLAFFSIIKKLVNFLLNKDNYIQSKLVIERNINWTHIHGFRTIIQAITYELQTRDINKFHIILIDVLKTFINDHDIMNLFATTVIYKAK